MRPLQFISKRINALDYQNMIGPLFPASGYKVAELNWKLQQDNAPIYMARFSLNYFKERHIPLFQNWPAKSPDMNIIKNVWSILSWKVYNGCRQYDNVEDLVAAIETGWKSIDQSTIQGLYIWLQRRLLALYDARGKSTRY